MPHSDHGRRLERRKIRGCTELKTVEYIHLIDGLARKKSWLYRHVTFVIPRVPSVVNCQCFGERCGVAMMMRH